MLFISITLKGRRIRLNKRLYAALEGLLYITGEDGLTLSQIAVALEVSEEEAKMMVEMLKNEYDKNGRGITIINTANVYKMTTSERYYEYYKRIYQDQHRTRLSNAAMEVLAIIAYKQPLKKVVKDTDRDYFMSAEEAQKYGIIDRVVTHR